ncbi:MAG: hypothetical protein ACREU6_15535 [Steroidobacteraceae bacterium]
MTRNRAIHAALAAVVIATALLCGCASPEQPGMEHGHIIQPPTTERPFCANHPFGEVKSGLVQRSVTVATTQPVAIASDDHPFDAGKLLVLSHPLEPLPLEIARIRRGMVKRFTGKFIEDGVTAWSGLDLGRLVAVSVERHVFDLRAHLSRPVPDPSFAQPEQLSFARKWTDGQRTEVEVVKVFPITLVEAQLFVCAANPVWADKNPQPDDADDTNEMSDGVTDVFLLDRRQQQDLSYEYNKPVDMTESLAGVLGSIWQHAPRGPAW